MSELTINYKMNNEELTDTETEDNHSVDELDWFKLVETLLIEGKKK